MGWAGHLSLVGEVRGVYGLGEEIGGKETTGEA